MELVVLSVCDEDVADRFDDELVEKLEELGLMQAVLERARKLMWNYIDTGGVESDCIMQAVDDIIEWNKVDIEY